MNDTPMTVTALTRQVVADVGSRIGREGYTTGDQPFNRVAAVFNDETGGLCVAQTSTRGQRVLDVCFDRIRTVKYGSDAALRPTARAVFQATLGYQCDLEVIRQSQCEGLAREAATNDEDVELGHDPGPAARVCRRTCPTISLNYSVIFLDLSQTGSKHSELFVWCRVLWTSRAVGRPWACRRHRIYWAPLRMSKRSVHNNLEAGR